MFVILKRTPKKTKSTSINMSKHVFREISISLVYNIAKSPDLSLVGTKNPKKSNLVFTFSIVGWSHLVSQRKTRWGGLL